MKFTCSLIAVTDVEVSRRFYEDFLGQKVAHDFGENVTFECGFAIQEKVHFSNMVNVDESSILRKSNNFELYFEEDDIESFVEKIKKQKNIKLVHELVEHPWCQRVIRFYDPDMHMVEVGESMNVVIQRLLKDGLSVEEIAKRTQHSVEHVEKHI